MKRIMVFWLVLLLPIIVLASEYQSDDINIKLNVNDDFTVFTRDNLDNNSKLEELGISKEDMTVIMKNNNIYLDIIKSDLSYEILVVVPDVTIEFDNLSKAEDSELEIIKNTIIGETGDNMPIIYKGKYPFIVVDYYDSNMEYYVMNYYTVMNHRGYNIQLQKKNKITEEDENALKEIVDSVEFKVIPDEEEKIDKKEKIDNKTIIYGAIIGAIAGIITYIITNKMTKKKQGE